MCGIAGICDLNGKNVSRPLITMLKSIEHRGPDGVGAIVGKSLVKSDSLDDERLRDLKGSIGLGHVRLAIVGGLGFNQPLQDCRAEIFVVHNGEVYNYRELKKTLEKRHRFVTKTDSEVISHLIEEYYTGDLSQAVSKAIQHIDGVYTLAVFDGDSVVIARDRLGVRQLYFGSNESVVAFASEKKALWKIGLSKIKRVPPGVVATIDKAGVRIADRQKPPFKRPEVNIMKQAFGNYVGALREAVLKRIRGVKKVGIIFSGGIDSILVAQLARNLGSDVTCYAVGMQGSDDVEYARRSAEELGFKYRVKTLSGTDVEEILPEVIAAIEDRSFLQVEVSIPIFEAVKMAHEDGCRVVLTGQAADELFAGYPWYRTIADKEGYDELNKRMLDDILKLYKETLEREDKIAMWHSVEMRVPYLDLEVVSAATGINPRLKLPLNDDLGKRVHRDVALLVGVPEKYAMRPKEAAQHGSGIHDAIIKIALKNGFSEKLALKTDYSAEDSIEEKLGSSQRYGYKYDEENIWGTPDYVQMYLDYTAFRNGVVDSHFNEQLEHQLSALVK
ncbi:MAG: asparagine synthase (glutamine-hydrolyzing) [Nitrososphaerales archaeon]